MSAAQWMVLAGFAGLAAVALLIGFARLQDQPETVQEQDFRMWRDQLRADIEEAS